MFLAFVGNDTMAARQNLHLTLTRLQEEMPNASLIKLDNESFSFDAALDAMLEGNLFAPKNIIIFDDILMHPEGEKFYTKHDLNSDHVIIVRETAPKKVVLDKLAKYGDVKTFSYKKEEPKINSFALADAIMLKEKATAWLEFEKTRRRGEPMEAVHGMIFWAFKTLTAIATLPKAEVLAAGVKDFTYRRGLEGVKKYTADEIVGRFDDLKDMYHKAHRGECDLEYSLEQFILKL